MRKYNDQEDDGRDERELTLLLAGLHGQSRFDVPSSPPSGPGIPLDLPNNDTTSYGARDTHRALCVMYGYAHDAHASASVYADYACARVVSVLFFNFESKDASYSHVGDLPTARDNVICGVNSEINGT